MIDYREILRLYSLEHSQRSIARGICSVSCHFEAIHRREIRIIYAKRNGFLTSFEMTDGATE